jgi:hypothetical protein
VEVLAMPRDVPGDPARAGASFVRSVVDHPAFRSAGVAHGRGTDCRWAVVDPQRHPLYVWRRRAPVGWSYLRTARALDAAIFTNGPMMGRRLPGGWKVTRSRVPVEFALWTAAGIATVGLARLPGPRRGWLLGGAAGSVAAWTRTFTGWVPCGSVHGRADGIDDRRDFDNEGAGHAWLGRFGRQFASYRIGDGDLPAGVEEGTGGLIRLVHDFTVVGRRAGDPGYRRDFADLAAKKGVVAWGLVPSRGTTTGGPATGAGVLVVLGGRRLDAAAAAAVLVSIGTRDAVATDQSGSVMMGSGRTSFLRAPSLPRQSMQLYGLCCR